MINKKISIILLLGIMLISLTTTITVSAYRYDFNFTMDVEVLNICPINDSEVYRARIYALGVDEYINLSTNLRQPITVTPYIDLNLEEVCSQTSLGEQISEYRNMTSYMVNNIEQCTLLYSVMNDTHYFANSYSNISEAYGRIHENYEECKNRSTEMKTERDDALADLKSKTSTLQNCITTRDRYNNNITHYKSYLEDAEKGGQNTILWVLAAALVGFFVGHRKKKSGTGEQEEFNMGNDEYPTANQ